MAQSVTSEKKKRSVLQWVGFVLWCGINIPLLGLPALILFGPKKFWHEFGSYILGTYKRDPGTGHILWIRWINHHDSIHFHWLVWGSFLLAFLQWAAPSVGLQNVITPFGVATAFFLLSLMCLLIYFRDTPIWSFLRLVISLLIIVVADIGIRLGMSRLDTYFDGLAASGGFGYQLLDWTVGLFPELLKRGIISPLWDGYVWLDPHASPGLWVLFGIGIGLILVPPTFLSIMRNRKEMDSANLREIAFGESDATEPVSMRRSVVLIPDVLEALSFFGDIDLKVQGGTRRFKNVFGASAWLRHAFAQLREHSTPEELREEARGRSGQGEDAAELVAGAVHDHEEHGPDFTPDVPESGDAAAAHH
ncbi:MAG: hypothetical protein J0M12_07335 [Deltaproteobacteria bacterium]|nr:hypothetical protein [Deltaproteobacteria bacterium]